MIWSHRPVDLSRHFASLTPRTERRSRLRCGNRGCRNRVATRPGPGYIGAMNTSFNRAMSPAPPPAPTGLGAGDDYSVVRRAVAYISEQWRAQPEVEAI